MKTINNNTYSTQKKQSNSDKATFRARKKMYDILIQEFPISTLSSIIDVGVTADKEQESSNFFEKFYPYPERLTAFSNQDASWMEETYKGLKFKRGDGLDMPFEDNTFDLTFSSAVIEHVGNKKNQQQFIKECIRVSKKYIFITTPNKFYPIELHTALPFLHWLPTNVYRTILRKMGKHFFALEENLNLLCKNDLINIMKNFLQVSFKIKDISFFGFKSNLLLLITKND